MGKSKKYALGLQRLRQVAAAQRPGRATSVSKFDSMAWTPKSVPVDFYLNGTYRGNYLLVERIAIQGSVQQ